MKILSFMTALFLLAACAHARSSTLAYENRLQSLDKQYGERLVVWKESCTLFRKQESEKTGSAGPFAYAKCIDSLGLAQEARSATIVANVIKNKPGAKEAMAADIEKSSTELVKAYPLADQQEVNTKCQSKGKCSFIDQEALMQRSHNAVVIAELKAAVAVANSDFVDSYKEERREEKQAEAIKQSKNVSCSGHAFGSWISVNCN